MGDDIVARLRQMAKANGCEAGRGCSEAVDEIERLRAAGDLLAAYVVLNVPPTAMCFAAVERWREARRG